MLILYVKDMKTKIMEDTEIKFKGVEALNKSLGTPVALRFPDAFMKIRQ